MSWNVESIPSESHDIVQRVGVEREIVRHSLLTSPRDVALDTILACIGYSSNCLSAVVIPLLYRNYSSENTRLMEWEGVRTNQAHLICRRSIITNLQQDSLEIVVYQTSLLMVEKKSWYERRRLFSTKGGRIFSTTCDGYCSITVFRLFNVDTHNG